MGQLQTFVCKACGYTAHISGERDVGMASSTMTIECLSCRELYDVVTSQNPYCFNTNEDSAPTNEYMPSEMELPPHWKAVQVRCPRRKAHRWREWNHPGKCPLCAEELVIDEEGPVTMWD